MVLEGCRCWAASGVSTEEENVLKSRKVAKQTFAAAIMLSPRGPQDSLRDDKRGLEGKLFSSLFPSLQRESLKFAEH